MKIERKWVYWNLLSASYKGHEVCFALTNHKKAEPVLQLTSEVNKDWKIILMPLQEGTDSPTQKEFIQMEEYFWVEGYFDYLEIWYNWLNSYPAKLKDVDVKGVSLEKKLLKTKEMINKKWRNYNTIKEYTDDDER